MIPFKTIRSVIVRGLKTYTQLPVIEMNSGGDVPEGPFITYHFPDGLGDPRGHPTMIQDDTSLMQVETVTFTVSFLCYADDAAASIEYAMHIRDWFKGVGHDVLKDAVNVVVVEVGTIENRDVVLEDVWERRHGIDVELRTLDMIETDLESIEIINL